MEPINVTLVRSEILPCGAPVSVVFGLGLGNDEENLLRPRLRVEWWVNSVRVAYLQDTKRRHYLTFIRSVINRSIAAYEASCNAAETFFGDDYPSFKALEEAYKRNEPLEGRDGVLYGITIED